MNMERKLKFKKKDEIHWGNVREKISRFILMQYQKSTTN